MNLNSSKLKWNPDESTLIKMKSNDYYISFKAFRKSSTGYVNKKFVKEFVYHKYDSKCFKCDSKKDLHIDHIISVHKSYLSGDFYKCNNINNLQLLCCKCNLKKGNK